jgi:glycosyltransferase involved in cell wall biosynthesis
MSVLFVSHKYPPAVGGMEKQSYELISRYTSAYGGYKIVHEGRESIVAFFWRLKSRVKTMIATHPDIDTIHLNDGLMAALWWAIGIKMDKRIVVTLHGLDVVFPLGIYQKWALPKVAKAMDAFVCVSSATREECLKRGFDPEKVSVVKNGVDHSIQNKSIIDVELVSKNYGIKPQDKLILGIGRPVKRKGFSWWVEHVLPILPRDYRYIHIGDIPPPPGAMMRLIPKPILKLWHLFMGITNDATRLSVLSQQADYQDQMILAGRVDDATKEALIARADLVIMPNIVDPGDMEGFGLVSLEAAIMGKTVLASGIEGITDAIIDGKNGFLVKAGDHVDWQKKIVYHATHRDLSAEDIQRYTIENYKWAYMVDGYRKVFIL